VEKLILKNSFSSGDVVMLTAALRDLHRCYPARFITDVRTPGPVLWENNPHVSRLKDDAPDVKTIDCLYPLINASNRTPHHLIHGFIHFLNEKLNLDIKPTEFKGDIYISEEEKSWVSQVHELTGQDIPFWIIVSGGKKDYTAKWWSAERYQEVVDHFRGKIQFAQVGALDDHHPPLEHVINLVGKTDLRQLVRLVYHSQGVLCPVTALMHLAAAVEVKGNSPQNRPCVVVAGGREPSQWEAYPHHQFIHTNGSLRCCDQGGCWKSRTVPLGDGDEKDRPEHLCVDVVGKLPRCMDMITARDVIERIELYYQGGALSYLTPHQNESAQIAIIHGQATSWDDHELENNSYLSKSESFIHSIPTFPDNFQGKGIVICAGGITYFTNAWVCINMLRQLGCTLPIQLWHIGPHEVDGMMKSLLKPMGVECIDVLEVAKRHPMRQLNGWSIKPYAVLHSSFEEVLYLDADNVPIVNPNYLFDIPEYRNCGAVFWPDMGRLSPKRAIWEICGVPYRDEPEFESGQMLINKRRAWRPLSLALWYNENSDFYYQHIYGDKDTYHMAFRKLDFSYAMPNTPVTRLKGAMCQHDFQGRRIFQHRNVEKWGFEIEPKRIEDFQLHDTCVDFIRQLKTLWNGRINGHEVKGEGSEIQNLVTELISTHYELRMGSSRNIIGFTRDGRINSTKRDESWTWSISSKQETYQLKIYLQDNLVSTLDRISAGRWKSASGESLIFAASRQKTVKGQLLMRASVNSYTGYGLHAQQIVSDFLDFGYETRILPIGFDEVFSPIPEFMRDRVVDQNETNSWELLLHSPNTRPTHGKRTVYFTMWEASGLPPKGIEYLNEAECVIVPCQWNLEQFLTEGVSTPIHKVPLGINTDIFTYSTIQQTDLCIFGTAGRTAVGGIRKGFDNVIQAFIKAFPSERDVRLHVKVFPDCEIPRMNDTRIVIVQKYFAEREMAAWFRSITCFVSAARSEGWGLMQQQALATGRPLISVEYGGVKEFFSKDVGYPLRYKLVPAQNVYSNCGVWAEPSIESIVERMREVYKNRERAIELGKKGAIAVKQLSWQSSNSKLLDLLVKIGAV
jgi:glycosyltransferase involved in cell wall biosynthesis/ADP-heptose:LPS heptosyltransferase